MISAKIRVTFGDHISLDRVASMVTSIAAYGNVLGGSSQRQFMAEVFRTSQLPQLKSQLTKWERYGFLVWLEETQSPD